MNDMKNAMGTILPIFFVEILGNVYNKWKDPLETISSRQLSHTEIFQGTAS